MDSIRFFFMTPCVPMPPQHHVIHKLTPMPPHAGHTILPVPFGHAVCWFYDGIPDVGTPSWLWWVKLPDGTSFCLSSALVGTETGPNEICRIHLGIRLSCGWIWLVCAFIPIIWRALRVICNSCSLCTLVGPGMQLQLTKLNSPPVRLCLGSVLAEHFHDASLASPAGEHLQC